MLRLAFTSDAGALEGAAAIGGWGLSLLPVHCVPESRALGPARARARARAARRSGPTGAAKARVTRAWRRRRWGGKSGPS
ncbi:hypothetical protein ABZ383_11840 [Streptomyces sp. NPDC005900]|uniref:hypothetical protein n=1 Tax=unclassified Streptomyces TaxID=2593676 RepID=UPI0033CC1BC4